MFEDGNGFVGTQGFFLQGTVALGLFAAGSYGLSGATEADDSAPVTGLLYGGGGHVLWVQTYGVLLVGAATLGVSLVLMLGIRAVGLLRVSERGERQGLDIHEHGASAYPEFAVRGCTPQHPQRPRDEESPAPQPAVQFGAAVMPFPAD